MLRSLCVLTALAASPTWAQYAQDDRIEAPKAPAEFWRAVTFQMNTGKYDAAAYYMKGFLASNPSDQDLTDLEAKDGLAAFLRLRNVARWSPDAKVNDEAKKNAEEIITRVHAALEKKLGNQGRINRLVAALRGDPEERAFALKEVQRSGARAVPALVAALRGDTDATARATILTALPAMPEDSVAPLLASLDMSDGRLRYEILQSLGQRVDFAYLPARPELNPLPTLDYLSSSPNQPKDVQQLARSLITRLRPVSRNEVKPGKVELTDAAVRFHKHQERFARPDLISVWRWEGDDLALTPSTVSQAEEYFGLRYARWALELDPDYLPAQVAFLSIATDKAMGRAGIAADLTKADPPVHDLLATSSAAALMATLDQAVVDRRTTVALAVTKALAGRDEVKAAQPARYRAGVLVRALEYPDRRVQLAAADALVRIPGPFAQQNQTKVVEILRRSLSSESEVALPGKPRVLVAHYDAAKGRDLAGVFREAGFDVVTVRTGREVMARVRQANDIDFVAIDSEVPYPPLPDVLAHFRYDTYAKSLPVRVIYQPQDRAAYPSVAMETRLGRTTPQTVAIRNEEERVAFEADNRIRALTANMPGVELVRGPMTAAVVKASFEQDVNVEAGPALSADERKAAAKRAIGLIRDLSVSQPGIDLKPADRAIREAMKVDDLAADAIVAAGRLSGREAQIDLAALTLDAKRKPELRLAAAENLVLHIQRFGATLTPATGDALVQLAGSTSDPVFRGQVASVVGVLTPEGKTTGIRLQRYFAPKPGSTATKPAAAPEKKPEPEKKPTPDDEDK